MLPQLAAPRPSGLRGCYTAVWTRGPNRCRSTLAHGNSQQLVRARREQALALSTRLKVPWGNRDGESGSELGIHTFAELGDTPVRLSDSYVNAGPAGHR
jgi:hypothetical protein